MSQSFKNSSDFYVDFLNFNGRKKEREKDFNFYTKYCKGIHENIKFWQ